MGFSQAAFEARSPRMVWMLLSGCPGAGPSPQGTGSSPRGASWLLPVGHVLVHLTCRPSPSVSWPFSRGDGARTTEPAPGWKEANVHHDSGLGQGLAVHMAGSAQVSFVQSHRPPWSGLGCELEVLALQGLKHLCAWPVTDLGTVGADSRTPRLSLPGGGVTPGPPGGDPDSWIPKAMSSRWGS